jgi:hypothetical protein
MKGKYLQVGEHTYLQVAGDIQPAIAKPFEDVGKLPWLGVAFLLGAASTNLVSIFL